ncbi:MAG: Na/Pi cotransporter family protein [Oscillospiraceae bacterium]|jgi:phosphate:Na+ symporter|nr:Na/Pi cotransporter family protein [Oscillospiraceae bacterium]
MNIYDVLGLLGGLMLFLYGMNVMGDGLERASGSGLERTLEKLTNSPLKGVILGAGVTAVIQASGATTVMVVGFVNSGIMKLSQAINVIMGANIGTTITAWILSMSSIESDNLIITMLKPTSFAPVLGVIGVVFAVFTKNGKKKDVGMIFVGFAMLIIGMTMVTDSTAGLKDVKAFTDAIVLMTNPFLGILAGIVMSTVFQSSSAAVGVLQALCATGSITYGSAIPIIMGQNIGTCSTALFSSVGANKNARRAAMVHLYFNLIGTTVILAVFYGLNAIFRFSFINDAMGAANVAIVHTIFNVVTTLMLLPLGKFLGRLAEMTVKDGKEQDAIFIDERFLNTPSFAIEQCNNMTLKMAELTKQSIMDSINCVSEYSSSAVKRVKAQEEIIDRYEDTVGSYLVKLSSYSMSLPDSRIVSKLLYTIGDLERIGDHAVNIIEGAEEMHEKGISFSYDAIHEINVMSGALREIIDMTAKALANDDIELAMRVEPLEQVIDKLNMELKAKHVERLQNGQCTIELGFIFSDLIMNFERVADHCSNIALCMIQVKDSSFETHGYVSRLMAAPEKSFVDEYQAYSDKYSLDAVKSN